MKYVYIKGTEGLSNRLCTIMSAIEYCRITNRRIYVDWSDGMYGREGDNVFYKYFKINSKYVVDDIDTFGKSILPSDFDLSVCNIFDSYACDERREVNQEYTGIKKLGIRIFRKMRINNGVINHIFKNNIRFYESPIQGGERLICGRAISYFERSQILVYVDSYPFTQKRTWINCLRLNPNFKIELDRLCIKKEMEKKVIGVHVRLTDILPGCGLDKLLLGIKDKLGQVYEKVFLATDNLEIRELFKKEFGDKLIYNNQKLPKVKNGGIHHFAQKNFSDDEKEQLLKVALQDLYFLYKSAYLFYQGNSTYSLTASIMRNNKECVDWLKL